LTGQALRAADESGTQIRSTVTAGKSGTLRAAEQDVKDFTKFPSAVRLRSANVRKCCRKAYLPSSGS